MGSRKYSAVVDGEGEGIWWYEVECSGLRCRDDRCSCWARSLGFRDWISGSIGELYGKYVIRSRGELLMDECDVR